MVHFLPSSCFLSTQGCDVCTIWEVLEAMLTVPVFFTSEESLSERSRMFWLTWAHRIGNGSNYNDSCVLSESPPPFYKVLCLISASRRCVMKHLWVPVWWMDGNGAVNACSCFCLNAQHNGNQNITVVGTSYRITWLLSYSQPEEGRKKWWGGKYKRISSILKSLHNKTLSSFVIISMSLFWGLMHYK